MGAALTLATSKTTSSLAVASPSNAVSLKVKVPSAPKVTCVVGDDGLAKVIGADGGLTTVQTLLTAPPVGNPSSMTDPARVKWTDATAWSGPARATGASFPGLTTSVSSSLVVSTPSDALSRSTYVPRTLKLTDVEDEDELA